MTPQEELDEIYESIGSGEPMTDEIQHKIEVLLKKMESPKPEPMSFDEWCYDTNIEDKYEVFHGEYGDAACMLSDYKKYHYQEYLENFIRGLTFQ